MKTFCENKINIICTVYFCPILAQVVKHGPPLTEKPKPKIQNKKIYIYKNTKRILQNAFGTS